MLWRQVQYQTLHEQNGYLYAKRTLTNPKLTLNLNQTPLTNDPLTQYRYYRTTITVELRVTTADDDDTA